MRPTARAPIHVEGAFATANRHEGRELPRIYNTNRYTRTRLRPSPRIIGICRTTRTREAITVINMALCHARRPFSSLF
jgi:hypothetical protein